MERIDCILANGTFKDCVKRNMESEKDRIFCRHDMSHMLDVCRVAWILNLESGLLLPKEMVYAAGLLHDIGRWQEYLTGRDHSEAGAELAEEILGSCGFNDEDIRAIVAAILEHRERSENSKLGALISRADKASRPCFDCPAIGRCKRFVDNHKPSLDY